MERSGPASLHSRAANPGPLVGALLDGRYQVTSTIARGGMATVYQSTDTRLEREVALKAMHPFLADDPEFLRRFTREARAAARISDRNVVSVYDQGTDPATRAVFLVMELVRGRTLRALLDARGRLTVDQAISVLGPVSAALAAAHATGVVHRDVKPENVLLGDDGRVLVADFGLARAVSASPATANAGLLIGTVAYLAPEQVRDGSADFRSDVYAAGVLLYELLTGCVPYAGDNPLSVAYRHLHEDVPPTGLDARIDGLLASATARDPGRRPVDGAELHARIRALRAGGSQPGGRSVDAPTRIVSPAGPGTRVMPAPGRPGATVVPAPSRPGTRVIPAPTGGRPSGPGAGRTPLLGSVRADPGRVEPGLPRLRRRHGVTAVVVVVLLLATSAAAAAGWWFGRGRYIAAPALTGLDQSHAAETAAAESIRLRIIDGVHSDVVRVGFVARQQPTPGARVVPHGTIGVQLSLGPLTHPVPLIGAGGTVTDATGQLVAAGLAAGPLTREYSATVAPGRVLRTTPAAGRWIRHDTPVGLVLSAGAPPVAVPRLRGALAIAATYALRIAGLTGVVVPTSSASVPMGVVIDQSSAVGARVPKGTAITYAVSTGPLLVTVPDVGGDDVAEASATLAGAGFAVTVHDLAGGPGTTVLQQVPRALAKAPEQSVVTVSVY